MDDLCPFQLGLHGPTEGNGMTFGHVGTLDNDAVRILQVAGIKGCGTAPETRSQTGNTGAVSYAGLVFNGHHSQASHQFLLKVVPFIVQGRTPERKNTQRVVDRRTVRKTLDKRLLAGL